MVNYQSKTVAEILVLLVVALSATTILTLSMPTRSLNAPLIISGAALLVAVVVSASILVPEVKGAPWVPTSRKLVSKALAMAELKPGELVYDLGSGDGRIVIAATRDFGARAVGIEIDPFRVLYSRLKISRLRLQDRARIVRGNFFNIDFGDADVVVLYLLQQTNNKLQRKLEKELTKPNCRVLSVVWKFEGWDIVRADEEEMIYVYRPRSEAKST
jgi:SAM-dependent methyltransferase